MGGGVLDLHLAGGVCFLEGARGEGRDAGSWVDERVFGWPVVRVRACGGVVVGRGRGRLKLKVRWVGD